MEAGFSSDEDDAPVARDRDTTAIPERRVVAPAPRLHHDSEAIDVPNHDGCLVEMHTS